MYACLRSIASYVPENVITNRDFEEIIDTNDEWITKRTGIKTRYFAAKDQGSSDLGVIAGELAMKRANIAPSEIDLVICATLSPDYFAMPSNACLISAKLGIHDKPAFDISAACTGFIYLLSIAKSFVESGAYRNILIVGAEKISSILDFTDRSTCVLFGDGAGAAVIGATENPKEAIVDVHISADGAYADLLKTTREGGGVDSGARGASPAPSDSAPSCLRALPSGGRLHMSGNEIFKLAVRTIIADAESILRANALSAQDVTYFIPHQANYRIISAVAEQLDFPAEKLVLTVQKYGNTSAASIPMAIDEIYTQGKLKRGDLLLLDAFGGGLTWGSALVHFGGQ
ncbi:3-oxoacyl-ACP synthase [Helicobacter sp. CLO-3]|uniref:beta-ketoacyl-ACP synthase III n=1 Tax=unclassified Helicobacter TaxID=2593540 RepID=UPI000804F199|nr:MULTISPECIES: beta-ketoacyl-ACP synthase III [unclassified Helicobacter]OBV28381.1 3-oxoacyl-ACP synthase [Helicobacter sp. CLO-3]OHU82034.1 3-oxoacyl-ACP synthase [Helicobacter sp. CLO-3]